MLMLMLMLMLMVLLLMFLVVVVTCYDRGGDFGTNLYGSGLQPLPPPYFALHRRRWNAL